MGLMENFDTRAYSSRRRDKWNTIWLFFFVSQLSSFSLGWYNFFWRWCENCKNVHSCFPDLSVWRSTSNIRRRPRLPQHDFHRCIYSGVHSKANRIWIQGKFTWTSGSINKSPNVSSGAEIKTTSFSFFGQYLHSLISEINWHLITFSTLNNSD